MPRTSARVAWLDWRFSPQSASTNPASLSSTRRRRAAARRAARRAARVHAASSCPPASRGLELTRLVLARQRAWLVQLAGPLLGVRGVTLELEESGEPAASRGRAADRPRRAVRRRAARASPPPTATPASAASPSRSAASPSARSSPPTAAATTGCRRARRRCAGRSTSTPGSCRRRAPAPPRRHRRRRQRPHGRRGDGAVANQPRVQTPPAAGAGAGAGDAGATRAGPRRAAPRRHRGRGVPAEPARRPRPRPERPQARASARRLDAWLEPRRGRSARRAAPSATVPYGVRVRIRGRLTDERGRPIGRAALAAVRREPGRPGGP